MTYLRLTDVGFELGVTTTAAMPTSGTDVCHLIDVDRLAATTGMSGLDDGGSGQ